MKRINISPHKIRAHLKRGGIIAYPTESSYGLGCLPTSITGIRHILSIKKRPQHKGLIVIGANLTQLQTLTQPLTPTQQTQLQNTWQNSPPTTFLVPARPHIPIALRGKRRNQIAIRVPQHTLARQLCHIAHSPLISTSCNRAKKRPCRTEHQVRHQFGRQALIIKGNTGGLKQPSRIIDLNSQQQYR